MTTQQAFTSKSPEDKKAHVMSNISYMHPKNYADVQFLKRAVIALLESQKIDVKKIQESRD